MSEEFRRKKALDCAGGTGAGLIAAATIMSSPRKPQAPPAHVSNNSIQSKIMTFVSKLKRLVLQQCDQTERARNTQQFAALSKCIANDSSLMLMVGTWITIAAGVDQLSTDMDLSPVLNDQEKWVLFLEEWASDQEAVGVEPPNIV